MKRAIEAKLSLMLRQSRYTLTCIKFTPPATKPAGVNAPVTALIFIKPLPVFASVTVTAVDQAASELSAS